MKRGDCSIKQASKNFKFESVNSDFEILVQSCTLQIALLPPLLCHYYNSDAELVSLHSETNISLQATDCLLDCKFLQLEQRNYDFGYRGISSFVAFCCISSPTKVHFMEENRRFLMRYYNTIRKFYIETSKEEINQ